MFSVPIHENDLIVFGGGGHGCVLIDVIRAMGIYRVVGVVDDHLLPDSMVLDVPVLGPASVLPKIYAEGVHLAVNGVGGIGNAQSRWDVFMQLEQHGFHLPIIIHPTAWIEPNAQLADGVQIFQFAHVGTKSEIGKGSVINVHAVLSHDVHAGMCANFSPGAILAGNVSIGDFTQVGMGATINLNLKIGKNVRIGNNATVKADVPEGTVVRAGTIWPLSGCSRPENPIKGE
jgi:sugar O-acyltransferase (sialic acid O-acetyltransferase NeuD family)